MPTFEYRCTGCGQHTDLFRTVSGRDAAFTCPRCKMLHDRRDPSGRLKARVITAPGRDQFLTPGHFGHTVSTTGLPPGEWEGVRARGRRWDSGRQAPTRKKGERKPREKRVYRTGK